MVEQNTLYCGDNLIVLPQYIPDESVDLVYLDPPFLPNPGYNVTQHESKAQAMAFKAFWHWSQDTNNLLHQLMTNPATVGVATYLDWMRRYLGQKPLMAYVVNMAARLVEFRRVLKPTGTIYFHTSPLTSSHTRILLDSLFPGGFINEIIWKRSEMHVSDKRYGGVHDNIYIYAKGGPWTWHTQRVPVNSEHIKKKYCSPKGETDPNKKYYRADLTGRGAVKVDPTWKGYDPKEHNRHWAFPKYLMEEYYAKTGKSLEGLSKTEKLDALLEEDLIIMTPNTKTGPAYKRMLAYALETGQAVLDIWSDISPIKGGSKEKIDNTLNQKPEELVNRILLTSSNPGDTVLDGFCGCGPMLICAQRLGRRWIGVDIAAEMVVNTRLKFDAAFPNADMLAGVPEIIIPATITEATRLFHKNPIQFQNWICRVLGTVPTTGDNSRPVKDRGIDGLLTFSDGTDYRQILVSVKGGHLKVDDVRALMGVVVRDAAAMGVFVCLRDLGDKSGIHEEIQRHTKGFVAADGHKYDRLQVITVEELLAGKRINMPQLKI